MPFHLHLLVVCLGLIGSIEGAFPADFAQGKRDRVPVTEGRSLLSPASGLVSTVRGGNLLFAAVSINHSPPTWWLVDTGATVCEFDLEVANRLHLKRSTRYRLVSRSKNRGERLILVETPDLSVGAIQCGPSVILAHPLVAALKQSQSPATWPSSFEKTGLLGMNLLVAQRALILWRKQQIYLDPGDDRAKSRADYEAEGYIAIPLSITSSRQVQIEGTLGGNHYQFCLDSGTPKTMVEQSVVDRDRLPSRLTNSVVRSPMNEFTDSKVSQVIGTRFQLGDCDISDRKILAASLRLTKSDRGDIWAGLIGADILWDYDAVIDFGSDTLYLRTPRTGRQAG